MKVYIVGVDTGSPSGLLASPYMEKELNVLGYQVEQFPAKDADSLMQALMQCAQPDALILCPLSGNLPADAACIHAAAQVCQKPLALNPGLRQKNSKTRKSEIIRKLKIRKPKIRLSRWRQTLMTAVEKFWDLSWSV